MSRGYGRVQRFVLAEVQAAAGAALSAHKLAERLAGGRPSAAQLESARRAIRGVAADERVEVGWIVRSYGVDGDWSRRRPEESTTVRAVRAIRLSVVGGRDVGTTLSPYEQKRDRELELWLAAIEKEEAI